MRLSAALWAICWLAVMLGFLGDRRAEAEGEGSTEMLLFQEVSVSSLKAESLQDSPGIVSLITEAEIKNSGARDLIDVLRMVPGIEFGHDGYGVVSISMRGLWAQEGKVSLRWDGLEMNDLWYGGLVLGNHFPMDRIKKIEIIRGPGSVIFGGFAELAVINIVTQGAADLHGAEVSALAGRMAGAVGQTDATLAYGQTWDSGLSLSGYFFGGYGHSSDQTYNDFGGMNYDLARDFERDPLQGELKMAYQGLEVLALADRYHTTARDSVGAGYLNSVNIDFRSYFLDAQYHWSLAPGLVVTPHLNFKYQTPWEEAPAGVNDPNLYWKTEVSRSTAGVLAAYDPWVPLNLQVGGEAYRDQGNNPLSADYPSGDMPVKAWAYHNVAAFLQASWFAAWVNVTAGARYEYNSVYGASFVPRLGLTKAFGPFHFKILASRAFRAPSMANIAANPAIRPEHTDVGEIEAGYAFSEHMLALVNAFDTTVRDPIVYASAANEEDGYFNFGQIHTRGVEIEYRVKDLWGYAALSYAYSRIVGNDVTLYEIPGRSDLLLGSPAHKVTLNLNWQITETLGLNPWITHASERFGYSAYDENGNQVLARYEPVTLVNVALRYRGPAAWNTEWTLGVYNLLNASSPFVMPVWDSYPYAPIPGPSREVDLRATWRY
jgi:outer membrane receptor protein involved in Fe transport